MKKRTNIMNQETNNFEKILFKNWVKKRFISALDIKSISYRDAVLWSEALSELGDELLNAINAYRIGTHEIVPFIRQRKK